MKNFVHFTPEISCSRLRGEASRSSGGLGSKRESMEIVECMIDDIDALIVTGRLMKISKSFASLSV